MRNKIVERIKNNKIQRQNKCDRCGRLVWWDVWNGHERDEWILLCSKCKKYGNNI